MMFGVPVIMAWGILAVLDPAGSARAGAQEAPPHPALLDVLDVDHTRRPGIAVVRELANSAQIALWIDGAARERLDRAIVTIHGTGMSRIAAMRRAARQANVECLVLSDRVALVTPELAPAIWQNSDRWHRSHWEVSRRPARDSTANLRLTDVTLSRFCRALEEAYGVEVVLGDALRGSQELLSLEGDHLRLQDAMNSAATQLATTVTLDDGVVMIGDARDAQARRDSRTTGEPPADSAGAATLRIRGDLAWNDLAMMAAQKSYEWDLPRDLRGVRIGAVEAEGDVASVVRALLLCEGWTLEERGTRRAVKRPALPGTPQEK